ncbi:hypothetical protein GWK47_039077 [Chionoecetes opilio]|uniref:Uncharacterized protein n=1 Tax=Chionoecetes opilio TaxID=41210 RepID=A0A8J4YDA9_CHIOP|nr:hypothetical protein GWK47_039077 [Chionoecetes opilio]
MQTQKEGDTRMMLHVAHAAQHGHHQIQVRTVDTDVVVLAVMVVQKLPAGDDSGEPLGQAELRYIAAPEIASSLGPKKTCALPMFHAITGGDTVSPSSDMEEICLGNMEHAARTH